MPSFPSYRPRRLRRNDALRRLVRETWLEPSQFVLPLFIRSGTGVRQPIESMPGVAQTSVDELLRDAHEAASLGIGGVLLFGIPDKKDAIGSDAWNDDAPVQHAILDASQGVTVEKVEPLVYRIAYQGRSVLFALNDLRNVKPPAGALAPDETFIGPIFDESAIRFFLVYNPKLKLFHYILDETEKVADSFFPSKRSDRILIGKRTGFAFYKDHRLDRKILIGAFAGNIQANNYFDGPFDQLPDNFIEGEVLRRAILQVQPALKGRIDRFGSAPDGSIRFMIAPYLAYQTIADLGPIHACAQKKHKQPDYYRCFVTDDESGGMVAPRPNKNARRR